MREELESNPREVSPPHASPHLSFRRTEFHVENRELKPFTQGYMAGWSQNSFWWKVDMSVLLGFKKQPPTPSEEREPGKK